MNNLVVADASIQGDAVLALALFDLLKDTRQLEYMAHQFHWNITGDKFKSMHDFYEEEYDQLFKNQDEIAEQIRQQGFFVPVIDNITLDGADYFKANEFETQLIHYYNRLGKNIELINKVNDLAKDNIAVQDLCARLRGLRGLSLNLKVRAMLGGNKMSLEPSEATASVTAGKLDKSDEIAKIDKFLSNLAKKYKVADIEKGRDFGTNPTTSFDWHLYKYSRIKPSGMDNTKMDVIYNAGDITISAHKGDTGNGNIKQKSKIYSVKTLERYAEEFAKWAFSDNSNDSSVTAGSSLNETDVDTFLIEYNIKARKSKDNKDSIWSTKEVEIRYNEKDKTVSMRTRRVEYTNIRTKQQLEDAFKRLFVEAVNSKVTAEFSDSTRKELENLGFRISKSGDSAMRENEDGSLDSVECTLYFSSAKDRRSLINSKYTDDKEFNKENDLINHIKNKSKATASAVTAGFDKGRYKEIDEESKFFKILREDCDIRPKIFYAINKGLRLAIRIVKGTFENASIRYFALKNKGGYIRVELNDKVYIIGYTIYESGKIKVWTRELKTNVPVNAFDYSMLNMYAKPANIKMIQGMLPTWMSI